MKIDSNLLLNDLTSLVYKHISEIEVFKKFSFEDLNYKLSFESWSILECIEHLNRFGDFYIPEIQRKIEISEHRNTGVYKSGVIGNYFAKSMLPKAKLNKIKTFKSMDPNGSLLDRNVLEKFLQHQKMILKLLEEAKSSNLTKIKIPIFISKHIKLRLGDIFRILIYHNSRHIDQAKNSIQVYSPKKNLY